MQGLAEFEPQGSAVQRTGWRRWARLAGGWLLLIAGLAGFVLPVIPGIPLLLAGLALLAYEYVWARRLLERVKAWWEEVRAKKG
jgi:uncharacterized protein